MVPPMVHSSFNNTSDLLVIKDSHTSDEEALHISKKVLEILGKDLQSRDTRKYAYSVLERVLGAATTDDNNEKGLAHNHEGQAKTTTTECKHQPTIGGIHKCTIMRT